MTLRSISKGPYGVSKSSEMVTHKARVLSSLELELTCSWWREYSDRKNDEEDEHVADSLLYDRCHLPRAVPAPDVVFEARKRSKQQEAAKISTQKQDR